MESLLFTQKFELDKQIFGPLGAETENKEKEYEAKSDYCLTKTGDKGTCIQYFLCNANQTANDDIKGVIDIHSNVYDRFECNAFLSVCCPPENQIPVDKATPPPAPIQHAGCGWRNPEGIDMRIRSVDDRFANFAEFPWVVAVLQVESQSLKEENLVYIGSGSLIHPSVILTVAHIIKSNQLKVRAGEWDAQSTFEVYPHQERDVEKVVLHKDYDKKKLVYDVALLFLKTSMTLAPNVAPICLPGPVEVIQPGTRCFATGWDKEKFNKKQWFNALLNKLELPIVDHADCQKTLRTTRLTMRFMLHSSFLCAGGEKDQDTCRSRGGGSPLVCSMKGWEGSRYVLTGLSAWSVGCEGLPSVFADVATVVDWVHQQTSAEGFSLSNDSRS